MKADDIFQPNAFTFSNPIFTLPDTVQPQKPSPPAEDTPTRDPWVDYGYMTSQGITPPKAKLKKRDKKVALAEVPAPN